MRRLSTLLITMTLVPQGDAGLGDAVMMADELAEAEIAKRVCAVATTANITLSAAQIIDGVCGCGG